MRIFWIKTVFLLFLFALIVRLFYWQVVKAQFLQSQAENQHFTDTKIDAVRGNILFSDGSILASINPSFALFGLPKLIPSDQKVKVAFTLAKILSEDSEQTDALAKDLVDKLSQDLYWVPLKKNVSIDQKKQIEELNLQSVGFDQSSNRFYPEGSSSAHLLGFVGSDAKGAKKRDFGLEGYYNGDSN